MNGPAVRTGAEAKAARVRLFLVDVDGVLTDGGIILDDDGRETKRFNVRDGHGIVLLRRAGIDVGIITGRTSRVVEVRARDLGISLVRQGVLDKLAALREVLDATGRRPEEVSYVGDDLVDLPILRNVGFAAVVADADAAIVPAADYVSSRPGGHGAVREIIEFVLRAQGAWDTVTAKYLAEGAD